MPFFSFILNKNYLPSELGIFDSNTDILYRKRKYYCKNTKIWNMFSKKNNKFELDNLSFENLISIKDRVNKVIFCIPPNIGLGDAIEYGLAFKAIEKKGLYENISLAFCSRYYKILSNFINPKKIYSDFVGEDQMNEYKNLFHFTSEIESLKLQKYQRKNIELNINKFFNVSNYRPSIKKLKNKISRISIFPISKSPIRTLSVDLINDINKYLLDKNYVVDLVLGDNDLTSSFFLENLKTNLINIHNPSNLSELNNYIKNIEIGIFCDSGPLHLAKIYRKKGLLISTSVDSNNILNKEDNIVFYNSEFESEYCSAPCGLTNIINLDNQHGCFNTLKKNKNYVFHKSNISLLNRGNLEKSYKNFVENPVGCVKSIKFENIRTFIDQLIR